MKPEGLMPLPYFWPMTTTQSRNVRDTPRHQGQRRLLIEKLREKGIFSEAVLAAMGRVPRHLYLDSAFDRQAYEDVAFQIGAGQTISQPSTVAHQSTLLQVTKGMKVLEIGTGSGYQASVLAEMGAKVFSVERQKELFDRTRLLLPALGYQIRTSYGDGYLGLPSFAPFDRVIVTAGAPFVPDALTHQLAVGGILVIPVDGADGQEMLTIRKEADGSLSEARHGSFRFVPMLGDRVR